MGSGNNVAIVFEGSRNNTAAAQTYASLGFRRPSECSMEPRPSHTMGLSLGSAGSDLRHCDAVVQFTANTCRGNTMAQTFFDRIEKKIFSIEELQTQDRELSYQPASPQRATTLSAEQVETFNRDGCLLPLPGFGDDEIAEHRRCFDRLLEEVMADGADSLSVVDPHLKNGKIYDLMFDPRIVSSVRDLIGDDVACWGLHYFCKLPHDDRQVAWHQDAYYWPFEKSRTVTVWLAIDDADHDNGCMQFVVGSHLHGAIPHRVTRADEKNALRFTVDGVEAHGRIVDVALRAGQFSLHSDMLLHGSGGNPSGRRRCGLTMRYIDANVRNFSNWNRAAVMICGKDRNGHWANPPRPE